MYTTTDEHGILNNFAAEPKMYFAASPSPEQRQSYVLQGAIAVLLVTFSILTAFAVS